MVGEGLRILLVVVAEHICIQKYSWRALFFKGVLLGNKKEMEAVVVDAGSKFLKAGFAVPDQEPRMVINT